MKSWAVLVLVTATIAVLVGGTYVLRGQSIERDSSTEGSGLPSSATNADSDVAGTTDAGDGRLDEPQAAEPRAEGSPKAAGQVAAAGDKMEQVTEPPGRTIAMLDPERMPIGTRLQVEFEPFGIGPWGDDSLVIRLNSVTALSDEAPNVSELAGVNVIVRVEPSAREVVTRGGAYAGTLHAVAEQGAVVLSLEEARPVRE